MEREEGGRSGGLNGDAVEARFVSSSTGHQFRHRHKVLYTLAEHATTLQHLTSHLDIILLVKLQGDLKLKRHKIDKMVPNL